MASVSGVILFDETIRQKAKDGTPLVKVIEQAGALPGIKVDKGTKPLAVLSWRDHYRGSGRLARALDRVSRSAPSSANGARSSTSARIPSYNCVNANAHALARYAALVPGGGPGADRRAGGADGRRSRHRPLLRGHRVGAEDASIGSSITPGSSSKAPCSSRIWWCRARSARKPVSVEEVAEKTLRVLKACVPPAVPGIAFLSGGQSHVEATAHLDAMNKIGCVPWEMHLLLAIRN